MELTSTNNHDDIKDNAFMDTELPTELTQSEIENETSFTDQDDESKKIIKFARIKLGKHIVMHKIVSGIFMILHFLLFFVTLLKIFNSGFVTTETMACYLTNPLIHIVYLLLNGFMSWFFFMNYLEASRVDLRLLSDNKKINGVIMVFSLVFLTLKVIADTNCNVWRVSWSDTVMIICAVTIECIFVNAFYEWYRKKASFLKFTLSENLDNQI